MKIRSSLPCSGIFMGSTVKDFSQDMSQPDGEQAEDNRERPVGAGVEPLAVANQVKGLQTEGGKGGVAAANADHEKLARRGAGRQPPVRTGPGGEETDGERAGDIDHQCADRERFAESLGDQSREPVTGRSTQCAAKGNPEIVHAQPGFCNGSPGLATAKSGQPRQIRSVSPRMGLTGLRCIYVTGRARSIGPA